jgi:hypothetical protein
LITGDQYKKLMKKPKAILWCRDGMYGMLPIEMVKNAITVNEDIGLIALAYGGLQRKQFEFHWNETVEIPAATGRLMGEYNNGN